MKKTLIATGLALIGFCAVSAAQPTMIGLAWTPSTDVYTGSTNVNVPQDGYMLSVGTNATQPLATFIFVTNVPAMYVVGTNYAAVTNTLVSLTNPSLPNSTKLFFVLTYTNEAGTAPPSNLALVRPGAHNPKNLSGYLQ